MDDPFAELLQATPSSRTKLMAAWDGLSVESQVKILHSLTQNRDLEHEVIAKALSSPNEYVRYLAARGRELSSKEKLDKPLLEKIAADSSDFVKYAQCERRDHWQITAEEFYKSPKAMRLAILSGEHPPNGEAFASLVEWAVERNAIPDGELFDLVMEYLDNPRLKTEWEGWAAENLDRWKYEPPWHEQRQIEALWRLVMKCPQNIALHLIKNLPTRIIGDETNIPDEVLDWLPGWSLSWFFSREDIHFEEFRKKVFFSTDARYTDSNRVAAVSHHFDLSDEECHRLLKERSPLLTKLIFARDLNLAFIGCVRDCYCSLTRDIMQKWESALPEEDDMVGIESSSAFDRRLEACQQNFRDHEVRRLRIYCLARLFTWNRPGTMEEFLETLSERLRFLKDFVVQGDTWATYMAFARALDHRKDVDSELPPPDDF
jgi:hypothetical protein